VALVRPERIELPGFAFEALSRGRSNILAASGLGAVITSTVLPDRLEKKINIDDLITHALPLEKAATIDALHRTSGKVAHAVLSFGGFMGIGEDYYPVPWSMLKYDTNLDDGDCLDLHQAESCRRRYCYDSAVERTTRSLGAAVGGLFDPTQGPVEGGCIGTQPEEAAHVDCLPFPGRTP
jgi:hypothetical protein